MAKSNSKLVQLKVGDQVRIKGYPLSPILSVEKIIKREGAHDLYYIYPGVRLYKREELYKIPIQSPSSKLAAKNNFWQGRVKSIQRQLQALGNDCQIKITSSGANVAESLILLSKLLKTWALIEDLEVKAKLNKLKQAGEKEGDINETSTT